jgi:hypothetical protein
MKNALPILLGVAVIGGAVYYFTRPKNGNGKQQGTQSPEEFKPSPEVIKKITEEKKAGEFTRVIQGTPQTFVLSPGGVPINKTTGTPTALVGHRKPGAGN